MAGLLLAVGVGALALCPRDDTPRERPALAVTVACAAAALVAECAEFWPFTVDDTWISLRYGRNLVEGHGLVFSTDGSPRVEGYTNLSWVLVGAGLMRVGLEGEALLHGLKAVGVACALGTLWGVRALVVAVGGTRRAAAAAALALAAVPELALWAVGGLETSLFLLTLVLGVTLHARERAAGSGHLGSAAALVVAALTRPEGAVVGVVLVALQVLRPFRPGPPSPWRTWLPGACLFAGCLAAHLAWRWWYYGYPLPNTYYARSGALSWAGLARRYQELRPFVVGLLAWWVLGAGALWVSARKRERRLEPVALSVLTLLLAAFAARREWMPGFRYELPFVPFLATLAGLGLGALRWPPPALAVVAFAVVAVPLPSAADLATAHRTTVALRAAHGELGRWLRRHAPPGAAYASFDMGLVPWESRLPRIIDLHPEGILDVGTAHRGWDARRLLAEEPEFLVLPRGGLAALGGDAELVTPWRQAFVVTYQPGYELVVHVHRRVRLGERALMEARALEERTRTAFGGR